VNRTEGIVNLLVNGRVHQVDAEPDTPLLRVLRDDLGLMGTKYGCGIGACGSCTVHVDGVAVRSCSVPLSAVRGASVTTIEGLMRGQEPHPVQRAWIEEQVPQCGYCQSGMIMAAVALLRTTPNPSDAEIDEVMTNLCRCGSYPRVRRAIRRATRLERPGRESGGDAQIGVGDGADPSP